MDCGTAASGFCLTPSPSVPFSNARILHVKCVGALRLGCGPECEGALRLGNGLAFRLFQCRLQRDMCAGARFDCGENRHYRTRFRVLACKKACVCVLLLRLSRFAASVKLQDERLAEAWKLASERPAFWRWPWFPGGTEVPTPLADKREWYELETSGGVNAASLADMSRHFRTLLARDPVAPNEVWNGQLVWTEERLLLLRQAFDEAEPVAQSPPAGPQTDRPPARPISSYPEAFRLIVQADRTVESRLWADRCFRILYALVQLTQQHLL